MALEFCPNCRTRLDDRERSDCPNCGHDFGLPLYVHDDVHESYDNDKLTDDDERSDDESADSTSTLAQIDPVPPLDPCETGELGYVSGARRLMRSVFLYLLIYAWFIAVGKIVWWLDYDFLNYDGPSSYLDMCSMLGWYALLTVGMLPAAWVMKLQEKPQPSEWTLGDYGMSFGLSAMLVFICLIAGMFVFGMLGLVVGWFSEDAANTFLRYTTIMQD